jgi:agmatinase
MIGTPFDPNAAAAEGAGLFGLPHLPDEAAIHCLPVPWEATTSYRGGTAAGPAAILQASWQVDLCDLRLDRPYEPGIVMLPEDPRVRAWNAEARPLARQIIALGGAIGDAPALREALARVNALSVKLNDWVRGEVGAILDADRIPALAGGDHSTPFGAIAAAAERHPGLGVLQVDAHMDLRETYQGFLWSHASITRNLVDSVRGLGTVVQVGVRDFCEEEAEYVAARAGRVEVHYDGALDDRRFAGATWQHLVEEMIASLPREVWITFDIDGLDPKLCPHTGTPVPGGLEFAEAVALLAAVARSGRRIVGFDLNEVAPSGNEGDEWDANVGARLLYQLCGWTLLSQGRVRERHRRG